MYFELSVESNDQKRTIYLPKDEADLIQEIYLMSIEGTRYIVYDNYLVKNQQKFNLQNRACRD